MKKLALAAVIFGAGMFAGSVVTPAHAEGQPHMQTALGALKAALAALENATADKGGHRQKAIEHTKHAIEQTEKGIAFDNKH